MSFINMPCFAHEEDEEEEQPKLSSSNSCRLIPSLIKEACAHCHVSYCLKSPSSLSSDDEDGETLPDSDLDDNKHEVILEIRSRAMKAKTKSKDCLFADSLHWVLSPTSGKLLIAPKEERTDVGEEDDGGGADDQSEVFHSVKSCFSRYSSSEKELDYYFSHLWTRSVGHEFVNCDGWPFGLYKKALVLPPLPSSPSESWTWRKRNQLGAKVGASTETSI